jgi:hypothetical protein
MSDKKSISARKFHFYNFEEDGMGKRIERTLGRFSKILLKIGHSGSTSIKTDAFEQVDRIAQLIDYSLDLFTKDHGSWEKIEKLFVSLESTQSVGKPLTALK